MEDQPESGLIVDGSQFHQPSLAIETQCQPDLTGFLTVDNRCGDDGIAPDLQDVLLADIRMCAMNPGMDQRLEFHWRLLPVGGLDGVLCKS